MEIYSTIKQMNKRYIKKTKPINAYHCKHCGKTVYRTSVAKKLRSFCRTKNKGVYIYKVDSPQITNISH